MIPLLAIAAWSGTGKTTLLKLLSGFYEKFGFKKTNKKYKKNGRKQDTKK